MRAKRKRRVNRDTPVRAAREASDRTTFANPTTELLNAMEVPVRSGALAGVIFTGIVPQWESKDGEVNLFHQMTMENTWVWVMLKLRREEVYGIPQGATVERTQLVQATTEPIIDLDFDPQTDQAPPVSEREISAEQRRRDALGEL